MKNTYCVTGTVHGSIIEADTESEARNIFLTVYPDEKILYVRRSDVPAWCY